MEKRYQVFVSSTYTDLLKERQEVMQALLELDCIPAGMELFPAADEDQWTLIKRVIDDCDYYIVILAGRYGSLGSDGKSFTQMEYEYAIFQRKPVIAFLHKDPGKLPAENTERNPEREKRLNDFRRLVKKKPVRYWTTPEHLGSVVSRSLIKLIKEKPATGWVKADSVASQEATQEILDLKRQVEEMQHELERVNVEATKKSKHLAQGKDKFEIKYTFRVSISDSERSRLHSASHSVSWSQIFCWISPLMINEISDYHLHEELNRIIEEADTEYLKTNVRSFLKGDSIKYSSTEDFYIEDFDIDYNSFDAIKLQLLALKLIKKCRKRGEEGIHWTLTPHGVMRMAELRAIHRSD